jgi:hypothetical protein
VRDRKRSAVVRGGTAEHAGATGNEYRQLKGEETHQTPRLNSRLFDDVQHIVDSLETESLTHLAGLRHAPGHLPTLIGGGGEEGRGFIRKLSEGGQEEQGQHHNKPTFGEKVGRKAPSIVRCWSGWEGKLKLSLSFDFNSSREIPKRTRSSLLPSTLFYLLSLVRNQSEHSRPPA